MVFESLLAGVSWIAMILIVAWAVLLLAMLAEDLSPHDQSHDGGVTKSELESLYR